jgi:hypothetical protein
MYLCIFPGVTTKCEHFSDTYIKISCRLIKTAWKLLTFDL